MARFTARLAPIDAAVPRMFLQTMVTTTFLRGPRGTWSLPNLLTYGRVAAVPIVVGCLFLSGVDLMRWVALGIFIAAAITDFLDGYLARALAQQSALGQMLDPIADKLLVAAVLMMLVADHTIASYSLWAADRYPVPRNSRLGAARIPRRTQGAAAGQHASPNGRRRCSSSRSAFSSPGRPATRCCRARRKSASRSSGFRRSSRIYTGWDYLRAGIRHIVED